MPTFGQIDTERKMYSEVLTSLSTEHEEQGLNLNFDTVSVEASDVDIEPLGYPVIYSVAADNFVPYVAQVIAAADADDSPLPAGARVALVVGDYRGVGFNTEDVTLVAAGTKVTALFGGSAGILASGVDFDAGTNAAAQAAFLKQLEVQGLTVAKEAADIAVKYI